MKYKPIAKYYYDGLDQGKFMGLRCPECGHIEFPPYPACNCCGHIGGDWVDLVDADVVVTEIYSISPMMTIGDFMPYAPLFSCEAYIEEGGIEFTGLIFGVKKKTYKTLREQVPLHGKLVVMPMDGYNSFAVSLNGAVPKKKGQKGTMDQAKVLAMLGKDKKDAVEADAAPSASNHPDNGKYKCVLEVMGQKRDCSITLNIGADSVSGVLEAMDETMPFEGGTFAEGKLDFSVEARGSEFVFQGTVAEGSIQGDMTFGAMNMKVSGSRE